MELTQIWILLRTFVWLLWSSTRVTMIRETKISCQWRLKAWLKMEIKRASCRLLKMEASSSPLFLWTLKASSNTRILPRKLLREMAKVRCPACHDIKWHLSVALHKARPNMDRLAKWVPKNQSQLTIAKTMVTLCSPNVIQLWYTREQLVLLLVLKTKVMETSTIKPRPKTTQEC